MFKRNLLTFGLLACVSLVLITVTVSQTEINNQLPYLPIFATPASSMSTAEPSTIPQSPTQAPSTPTSPKTSVHVSDSQALVHYEQGLTLYYKRQFPQALKLFNQALAIDPLCYEALNAKGATLAFQGEHDEGLALIQQALDLNPSFVYGNFNLGLANELAGRWDPAIAAYQKALQLDHRDTWSYYGIASIYGRLGNMDKVVEYLQPAIALDPDVKEVARDEQDFAPVRKDSRFQALMKP